MTAKPPPAVQTARFELRVMMWASLLPLMLVVHPYSGLVQDARIYIGRALADRDPMGVGQDFMFLHDGQTGFSLMRHLVEACLSVIGPASTSMVLVLVSQLAWLLAAVAVARILTGGRAAWAVAACLLALPTTYGAFGVFDYAEAIATPRLLAEAAVLGGLACTTTGRRGAGAALLAVALALHPLMALPGVAVGAALFARHDGRWLMAAVAGAGLMFGGALLGAPLASRLLLPIDDVWLSILRHRSLYLFPTLWPKENFGPIVCQAMTVIVAATLVQPGVRALLLAALGVSMSGLFTSWLFGDLWASTLITQLQPWRALWLLALFGNAGLAMSVIGLWRRGPVARLLAAPLLLAWLWSDDLIVAAVLASMVLVCLAFVRRGAVPVPSSLIARAVAGTVCTIALMSFATAAVLVFLLLRSAQLEGGAVVWPMLAAIGLQTIPVVAVVLILAVMPAERLPAGARAASATALGLSCIFAFLLWDGRTAEQRRVEQGGEDAGLQTAVGARRGEVLWVDENSETWFLLHRPSFLNTAQAGPILFSRDLALEWAARTRLLMELGMVRSDSAALWEAPQATADIVLVPEAVRRFCADGRRPAAVVAPGDQRDSAPPGTSADLWRPPQPFRRLTVVSGQFRWRTLETFTVIRCPAAP